METVTLKSLAHTSLVCPILEYGATCWGRINALDQVQNKEAKFCTL
jgi:hypothetical protein